MIEKSRVRFLKFKNKTFPRNKDTKVQNAWPRRAVDVLKNHRHGAKAALPLRRATGWQKPKLMWQWRVILHIQFLWRCLALYSEGPSKTQTIFENDHSKRLIPTEHGRHFLTFLAIKMYFSSKYLNMPYRNYVDNVTGSTTPLDYSICLKEAREAFHL